MASFGRVISVAEIDFRLNYVCHARNGGLSNVDCSAWCVHIKINCAIGERGFYFWREHLTRPYRIVSVASENWVKLILVHSRRLMRIQQTDTHTHTHSSTIDGARSHFSRSSSSSSLCRHIIRSRARRAKKKQEICCDNGKRFFFTFLLIYPGQSQLIELKNKWNVKSGTRFGWQHKWSMTICRVDHFLFAIRD